MVKHQIDILVKDHKDHYPFLVFLQTNLTQKHSYTLLLLEKGGNNVNIAAHIRYRYQSMASLQDQLLKAGMVDKKKAKQIEKAKRKEKKQQPKGHVPVNETREQAQRALNEKAARDKRANEARDQRAQQKAIEAQIIQLIELNKIARDGDIAFQFVDGKKIKKLYVTPELQDKISRGQLAIVKLREQYELVPSAVAQKISERDQAVVLLLNDAGGMASTQGVDEQDPYAEFVVPDDLMW